MLCEISPECLIHCCGVSEYLRNVRFQQDYVGSLLITFIVLASKYLPRTPPRRSYSGLISSSCEGSLGFLFIGVTLCCGYISCAD
jgi:hypothetical protein